MATILVWVHRKIYADNHEFTVVFRTHIWYTICMQKKSLSPSRSRAEILAEIAALPPSVQGRISSYKNVRKNGTTVIYNNLQWWADGRNHALFIPADKVSQIKEAIKQGKKMQKLVRELSLADAQEIIASGSALKKSSRTSS